MNDNIPQCEMSSYRLSIPENISINKPLIKIIGNDPDNDINGTINYSLHTNSSWLFYINKQTGEIYSKTEFDYESEFKSFNLVINLEDKGFPIKNQNKNACQLDIYIEDINDNAPELINSNETKFFFDINQIYQNQIINLNITDKDSGLNGKIKYNLQSIESNINLNETLFQLNQNGSLQILYKINQISFFNLQILLEDYGYPSKQTIIHIEIAFGDLLNIKYSTFEKIQLFFQEKQTENNSFILIFSLIVLIITVIFLISIIILCLCIRKHQQRNKTAIISRNKLLCSSSQQLTTSNSTVTTNTRSLSMDNQQIIRIPPYWNEKSLIDQSSSINSSSSPESDTYKILHIPIDMDYYEKDKIDNISCDHGYHESYQTGSPSSLESEQYSSSHLSIRRDYKFNQLPDFVTKCKTLSEGFIVEMNVDGSDEDTR